MKLSPWLSFKTTSTRHKRIQRTNIQAIATNQMWMAQVVRALLHCHWEGIINLKSKSQIVSTPLSFPQRTAKIQVSLSPSISVVCLTAWSKNEAKQHSAFTPLSALICLSWFEWQYPMSSFCRENQIYVLTAPPGISQSALHVMLWWPERKTWNPPI